MSFIQTNTDTKELISAIASEDLDLVLMLQFLAGWAGEGLTEPPRLNWWSTQLLDEDTGGDFFKRLLPRTSEWALLEATRKVAIRVDRQKRTNLAQPDKVRTLFFWGFGIDEKLQERLTFHKENGGKPQDILNFPLDIREEFEEGAFEEAVKTLGKQVDFKVVPEGREIKEADGRGLGGNPHERPVQEVIPESIAEIAKNLVSVLVPLADKYPMPFYRLREKTV